MGIKNVEPKSVTYYVFQYDGTEASISELAKTWEGSDSHPTAKYIDSTTFRLSNDPGRVGWMVGNRDTVCIFERDLDDNVRLVADYPTRQLAERSWNGLNLDGDAPKTDKAKPDPGDVQPEKSKNPTER